MKTRDSKEREAQNRRIQEEKKTSYNKMIKEGASNKAKGWFRRPAYSVPGKKEAANE